MEFNVMQQAIAINDVVFDEMFEQAVDCEIVLPDYCPDISRILKCRAMAEVSSKEMQSGNLKLEGTLNLTVLYVDAEEGAVKSYEVPVNFSGNKEFGVAQDANDVDISAQVDYLNCRALTSRKLDIHSAVTIHAVGKRARSISPVTGAQGASVQLRCDQKEFCEQVACVEKYLSIHDELEIPQGGNSIRAIIRSDAAIVSKECKVVSNKAIVKGEMCVKAFYCAEESGVFDHFGELIPFSQILDLDGITEDCICDLRVDVQALELHPRTGMDGECKAVNVSARLHIVMRVYRNIEIPVITDCYSTEFELNCEKDVVRMPSYVCGIHDTCACKKGIEMPQSVQSVLDVWCSHTLDNCQVSGSQLTVSGTVLMCLLANDADGSVFYAEKPADYKYQFDLPRAVESLQWQPEIRVASVSYTLSSAQEVEIRAQLSIDGEVFDQSDCPLICQMSLDESKPKQAVLPAALIIYYAKSGEKIWDIARKYNTTVESVLTANSLDDQPLRADTMLLIPCVH